ncbi:MAG TPA: fatty acid desaturase family protein [Chthoniobacterales bacterium]|nr:fatty acid desaturase family protein [Chthoniobacterales bacterium]
MEALPGTTLMTLFTESELTADNGDIYHQKIDRFIDSSTLKALSKIKPWRGILQIALEWFAIAGGIILCETYWHPVLYIATVIWIGSRQGGLAVMMHESTHYRLLPNRKWNDWVGEVFAAWPIFLTVYAYRHNHWAHHRRPNTPEDPDWRRKENNVHFEYPKSGLHMIFITLKYWLGIYAIKLVTDLNQAVKLPAQLKYPRLLLYTGVVIASIIFDFWLGLLIYWIVPFFTHFMWIVYVRGVAEHHGGIEDHDDLLGKTRHIEANFLERLFIAPNYIHVHIGHHLYPSVPFYNLRELQRLLMLNPDYARRAHVTKGYIGLVMELLDSDSKQSITTLKPADATQER